MNFTGSTIAEVTASYGMLVVDPHELVVFASRPHVKCLGCDRDTAANETVVRHKLQPIFVVIFGMCEECSRSMARSDKERVAGTLAKLGSLAALAAYDLALRESVGGSA